jgi:hypothetical protein
MTNFSSKCSILGQIWEDHREDKEFVDFVEYNDLGLPLAYLNSEGLAMPSSDGMRYIEETFELFLSSLNVKDTGFNDLNEVMTAASKGEE